MHDLGCVVLQEHDVALEIPIHGSECAEGFADLLDDVIKCTALADDARAILTTTS